MDFNITPLQNPNIDEETPLTWLNKHKTKLVFGGGALILLVGVFYFWLGNNGFSQNNVEVKIEGPEEISAGELATYKVKYENNNKVELKNAKLLFFYPDDAIVVKDEKILEGHSETIELETVRAKSDGEAEFQAYLVGDRGNVKTARVILSFSVDGISSVLEKDDQLATTISSLSVPLTLTAPPTAQSGQKITYILDYRNQSGEDKENIRIQFKYPEGFRAETYSPKPSSGNDTWDIARLSQSSGARISITGTISGQERETKTVSAVLQRQISTLDGDQYVDYEKTEASTTIGNPTLSASISVNKSRDYTAHLGDRLEYNIEVTNNSTYNLLTLKLSARLDGAMFDLGSVQSDGFFDSRSRTIEWSSAAVTAFADLKPGQTVNVPFTVELKKSFIGGGSGNSFVKVTTHAETDSVPVELGADKILADDELTTRISTSATFSQRVLVSDQAGSQGPFPPKVDQKTSYYIHWNLTNPGNAVTGTKVMGILAPGVKWESVARANSNQPAPTYNSRTNTVIWNLTELPGGVGTSFPAYEGVFKISLIPSVNQVGETPALMTGVNFSGTDSFTKENIVINASNINTGNVSDSSGAKTVQP